MSIKRYPSVFAVAILVASGFNAGTARAESKDASAGRSLFVQRCAACHSLVAGQNRVGPSLAGVVGRRAGTAPGFRYSPALARSATVWNRKALDGFLTNSSAAVPGNRMPFAGLPNPADRASLVAFLAGD